MKKNPMYLATNIKYYREKMGLSQVELAERLNIKQSSVANYELGKTKPEIKNLIELANIFRVSIDQLCKPIKRREN